MLLHQHLRAQRSRYPQTPKHIGRPWFDSTYTTTVHPPTCEQVTPYYTLPLLSIVLIIRQLEIYICTVHTNN